MKSNKDRIQELKTNGYSLDFETVFNLAFENYKKIVLYAGLLLLVFAVFLGMASFLTIAFTFGVDNFQELMKPENLKPENFSDNFLITYIISITLLGAILSPLLAGFIKMAHCAQTDEEFHVTTVFEYYKFSYFKELFLSSIMITIMSMGVSSVLNITGIAILGILGSLTISFLSILTIPLIIFSNYKAIDAINTSFSLVSKQPLILLGLLVVAYLFCITGVFMFLIGLLFTFPFMFSMYYAMYRTIIGFNE